MQIKNLGILIVILALTLAACNINVISGSGNVVTQDRSVNGFKSISMASSGQLIITQGDQEGLTIEAEDNLMEYIRAEVILGTLTIDFATERGRVIRPTRPIIYHVFVKDLDRVQVDGSGKIEATDLKTSQLVIEINGSADTQIGNLQADSFTYHMSGSGNGQISGQVGEQSIRIDGSGKYQAGDLESQTAQIQIGGSGEATVWAKDQLNVSIGGSGTVNYYGSPQISQNISGSGKLNSLGEK